MAEGTLTRGRLVEHALWSRALAADDLAGHVVLAAIVSDAVEERERVADAPGIERLSITELVREARRAASAGLGGILIFGASERKDETALVARRPEHVVPRAVRAVKQAVPDLAIATDVCVCAYTSHGQCVIFGDGGADVARTLEILQELAMLYADAGADLLIPSGMLDGSVAAVRVALAAAHDAVPVAAMAKLDSALLGAHRAAVGAMPIRDRAVPLLDPDDHGPTVARVQRDVLGGADAVVVKPGALALDLVHVLSTRTDRPIASFHTADERAIAASAAELVDTAAVERDAMRASRRAGASLVISYGGWSAAAD